MTELTSRDLRAVLREDLACFVQKAFYTLEPGADYLHNWHIDHLCWQLTRVARGEVRRLIINVPPRSMKSITVSVGFTAWLLGRDPTRRIICVSYADELARKLSVDARTVMDSPWYRALFPRLQFASRRPRKTELRTTEQGYRFAAGMSGSVLGRGADLIVIDDPIKATDALSLAERRRVNEAFDNTLFTRLDDKQRGAIVIVMQRLHQDDLVGHVLERDDWEVVSLPAMATQNSSHQLSSNPDDVYHRRNGELLHAAREPQAVLDAVRRAQGSLTFQAQYQQEPVPPDGNVIRRAWLRSYTDAERPDAFDRVVVSWDTASTLGAASDFSVGTVWGAVGLDYYLLDVVRLRLEVPDLRRAITRLSERWEADTTLIEDTELGRALAHDLRRTGSVRPLLHRPRFDKEARLLAQSARFEAGQVHLPAEAPWLAEYVSELLAFPNGRHDDQVDSTSQALNYLTVSARANQPIVRRNPVRRRIASQV